MCVCVCMKERERVCVCERERERESVCVCVQVYRLKTHGDSCTGTKAYKSYRIRFFEKVKMQEVSCECKV